MGDLLDRLDEVQELYDLKCQVTALSKQKSKLQKKLNDEKIRRNSEAEKWYRRGQHFMREAICAELLRQYLSVAAEVARGIDVDEKKSSI